MALYFNKAGTYNVAVGRQAGNGIVDSSYNTFVGSLTAATADVTNATAIGYGATVDASNKVRIGNAGVTVIEGQVPWSNPSDRRLKENIIYTPRLGLSFINRLQTVSYNYKADKTKIRYDGFIAQDIEKVMQELNLPFSGLKKSDEGTYSLAYSDFVIPLVNATKEQQQQIDNLEKQLNQLKLLALEIKNLIAAKEPNAAEKK
jgi:hypothetical protein